jgi:predicted aspartyl protease
MNTRTEKGCSSPSGARSRGTLRLSPWVVVGLVALQASLCLASPSPRGTDRFEEETTTHPTQIPFRLYNDNLIVVKGSIGPIEEVNLILDTGTSPTMISKELADRLKLGRKTESLQTLNGTIQAESVILPRIQIGALEAKSTTVVVQDLRFVEQSLGISLGGIAGLDILSTSNFTIDYRRRKIVFGPVAAGGKAVRFETRLPFLTVNARINGQELRLVLDSGTPGLLLYRNRIKTTRDRLRFDRNDLIFTAGGMTHLRRLRAEVLLGKDNLGTYNVAIADIDSDPQNDFDGLLGFAKMGFRKVSFDFENGLFGWD